MTVKKESRKIKTEKKFKRKKLNLETGFGKKSNVFHRALHNPASAAVFQGSEGHGAGLVLDGETLRLPLPEEAAEVRGLGARVHRSSRLVKVFLAGDRDARSVTDS